MATVKGPCDPATFKVKLTARGAGPEAGLAEQVAERVGAVGLLLWQSARPAKIGRAIAVPHPKIFLMAGCQFAVNHTRPRGAGKPANPRWVRCGRLGGGGRRRTRGLRGGRGRRGPGEAGRLGRRLPFSSRGGAAGRRSALRLVTLPA